ncbi:MAG: Transcriptional regulator containing HTH domain ArsR family [Candidatus Methanohalarchaeum thermophilum]|uniref:Transcriptional regulator containing HTH domain ArsR family n=1 Tax=Methanohalarchaeum thermophilum TaxID=1903181 RepID=A0A1Q6DS96_METT1|nr:MAG: Transcriptional regulator containing HTH domain ArsR family [Candidatus Methanohalarchaeum thermophilum]
MQDKFKALSSGPRIKLLKELIDKDGYTCICEFDDVIDKDRSVIYRHFKTLEKADMIKTRKRGKKIECKLKNPDKIQELFDLIKEV